MPPLVMSPTQGDLLKYEENPNYSREVVTLAAGAVYALGAVLGRITATGRHRLSPNASVVGSEGAEVAVAVLLHAADASAGEVPAVALVRGPAIVSRAALVLDPSVNDAAKTAAKLAQLVAAGVIVRDAA